MQPRTLSLLIAAMVAGCLGPGPGEPPLAVEGGPDVLGVTPELALSLTTPGVRAFNITVAGEQAMGWIGVPESGTSDRLLVVCKGFGEPGESWVEAVQAYADAGVLAVVMEYRGGVDDFKVKTGAEDTVAITLALQDLHPAVEHTVLYGISMGGEISGIAIASAPPGTYDHWVNGVGIADLTMLWAEHPVIRDVIEEETGGSPLDVPEEYEARSPLARIGEIQAAGLARVYMVYGAGDLIVPLDHGDRLYEALVDAGVPVTYWVLTTKQDTLVCEPVLFVCPTDAPAGPAGHDAGWGPFAASLVEGRLAGEPDPSEPALRYTREDITGTEIPTG